MTVTKKNRIVYVDLRPEDIEKLPKDVILRAVTSFIVDKTGDIKMYPPIITSGDFVQNFPRRHEISNES